MEGRERERGARTGVQDTVGDKVERFKGLFRPLQSCEEKIRGWGHVPCTLCFTSAVASGTVGSRYVPLAPSDGGGGLCALQGGK